MIQIFKPNKDVFYYLMGKFFSDRKIIKEMDCQIYSEDDMDWYISFNKEGKVVGFLSMQPKKDKYYLDNFYVIPNERGKGVGETLLKQALSNYYFNTIELISRNEIAINLFKNNGFEEYGQNGRYKKMRLHK